MVGRVNLCAPKGRFQGAAWLCAALFLVSWSLSGCGVKHQTPYTRPAPEAVWVDVERLTQEHPLLAGFARAAPGKLRVIFPAKASVVENTPLAYMPVATRPGSASCPTSEKALAEARQLHAQFESAIGNWLVTAEQLMSRELEEATYPWLIDLDYRSALARQERLQELLAENRLQLVRLALEAEESKVALERAEYWRQYDELRESLIAEADEAATRTRTEAVFSAQLMAQESVRGLQEDFEMRELALVDEAYALKVRLNRLAEESGQTVQNLCESFETYSPPSREGESRRIFTQAALSEGQPGQVASPGAAVRAQAVRETRQAIERLCRATGRTSYTDAQSRASLPDVTEELRPLLRRFWAGELEVERPSSG